MTDGPFLGFGFGAVAERLGPGEYEVVYETDRLQVGVYVPDTQQPHEWDELYFVLQGRGTLDVEGQKRPLEEGAAAFVAAHAAHRFEGYDRIVLLVIFDKT
jgi:mannose-6-phosphate isomerase-like protein (cupin superfamily)